ncbi:MAG TPA: hypothetical protein VD993_03900 [Chitinophagaceae bacterium]|nr:hypothetical protein [Chitinophagaceae bacterium]
MTRKHVSSLLIAIAANMIGYTFAQQGQQTLPENEMAYSPVPARPAAPAVRLNEVPTKAVRSFAREFSNADAKWYRTPDGFVVYFVHKNIRTKMFYDRKGNYGCTVRNYDETALPREIRHQVKSNYYDYQIYHVVEVAAQGQTAYIIKMESKTSWMDVKVLNNEMEILHEYFKR